ncbi:MAG TPA: hypothetical protein VNG71_00070 [Pyrinomonadaceae bacterium]|nr:hypothetical protein [Pyrinomonadaceae bacterium]
MSANATDPRLDRLYDLLPVIYRMRDADEMYPLQALLRVIAEQVNLVEDDISQLYDDWFIETAADWAVPYLAELIGYRPVVNAGEAARATTAEGRALNRYLIPRREVANTIRYRRRKGTGSLLELLAGDTARWPARVVEFFKLLSWNQNLNHAHLDRGQTVSLRRVRHLGLLDGPFDLLPHTVDVRRISSQHTPGRYNIPSVGLFVWRLKSYSVTRTPAHCAEETGPHCHTFGVLGQDTPLFIKPEPEGRDTHIAKEMNVPAPIRRRAFAEEKDRFYGENKSLAIWVEGWAGFDSLKPVPAEAIVPADLSDWEYYPPHNHIALDPVLGRFSFRPNQLPKKGVRVSYHYGFSGDMGGGEYQRQIFDPAPRPAPHRTLAFAIDAPGSQLALPSSMSDIEPDMMLTVDSGTKAETVKVDAVSEESFNGFFTLPHAAGSSIQFTIHPSFYRVGPGQPFKRLHEAIERWEKEQPTDAVIELMESRVYVEPIAVNLKADQTLQIRAANGTRAVLRLLDYYTDLPDALAVTMDRGSRLTLDGLLVTGRPLHVTGPETKNPDERLVPFCGSEVILRHCTFVPGWSISRHCEPKRPAEPSLQLNNVRARVRIEHSIVGSIQIQEDAVNTDPIPLHVSDSIIDATAPEREAIGAPGYAGAHVVLTMLRSTAFGSVNVHAVELAENSIFTACINVARRQLGCMRFCYVRPGCRTSRRYHCQPDLVTQAAMAETDETARQAMVDSERLRVEPQFTSHRYGNPGYAQLALNCADEIKRGADDESELGAFHNLFQPQREANLRTRLEEYTPAEMDVGIIFVT